MITKLGIEPIIKSYDHDKNEIDEVIRISTEIARIMNMHRWLRWTKFPSEFERCRTDSEYKFLASKFIWWLEETGLTEEVLNLGWKDEEND